jgi:MED6 mediator sub complex component
MEDADSLAAPQCFVDPLWLSRFPLNAETCLDYFANSGFYDRGCNNEILKMQNLPLDRLAEMTGTEYELAHANEAHGVFVIRQNIRESRQVSRARAAFYCVRGTVFRAPDLHAVLHNRVRGALVASLEALEEAAEHVRFEAGSPSGYSWMVDNSSDKSDGEGEGDDEKMGILGGGGESDDDDDDDAPLVFHRRRDERKRRKDLYLFDWAMRAVLPHFPVTAENGSGAGGHTVQPGSSVGSSAVPSRNSSQADLTSLDVPS